LCTSKDIAFCIWMLNVLVSLLCSFRMASTLILSYSLWRVPQYLLYQAFKTDNFNHWWNGNVHRKILPHGHFVHHNATRLFYGACVVCSQPSGTACSVLVPLSGTVPSHCSFLSRKHDRALCWNLTFCSQSTGIGQMWLKTLVIWSTMKVKMYTFILILVWCILLRLLSIRKTNHLCSQLYLLYYLHYYMFRPA
jgi:hypothetical protein